MREWVMKYRKWLAAATVLLLLAASGWYFMTTQAVKVLQDTLVRRANQEINGRLEVGSMKLALSGQVEIRDVALFDAAEEELVNIPLIKLSYRMTNLMNGNLDISRIESVSLYNARLWLQEEKEGWNWEHIIKKDEPASQIIEEKDKPDGQTADDNDRAKFKGKVEIKEGTVYLKTAAFSREMSDISGEINFKEHPVTAINLKGKTGTVVLKADGLWGGTLPGEIIIQSDEIDLMQFKDLITISQDLQLENGKLQNVQVTVKQDLDKNINSYAQGEFTELGLAGNFNINEGKGKFSGDAKEVAFPEIALKVSGQQMTGQGKVTFAEDTAALDFDITIPDLDPAQFLSGLNVTRPVALQIRLTGPVSAPGITGNVSIPGITTGDMTISGINGAIRYANNRLVIEQARGSVYQGALFMQGVVLPNSKSYELDVSGGGLDSSRLVDLDIQGPLDFKGRLNGRGEDVTIRGNFVIKDGKAYGLSFKTLTGNFIKRGSKTDITDIAINTSFGTLYPEQLSKEALEKARQKITERGLPTTKEEVRKVLTDKLREQLKF